MEQYEITLQHYRGTFKPDAIDTNLVLSQADIPSVGPNQVLVRVKAVSLNHRDLLVLTADPVYLAETVEGTVPVAEGAGIVEVSQHPAWKAGDRVIILPAASWKEGMTQGDFDITQVLGAGNVDGTLRQYVAFDGDWLVACPKNLSFEEAATLPSAYGTAWNGLFGGPQVLNPGHWIVTQGTGGVSIAALQIAVAAGASVIALSSSEEKMQQLRRLGAKETVNYAEKSDWSQDVLAITSGKGADHVVDVCGASTILEALRSVRQGGLVSVLGFLSVPEKHDLIPEIIIGAKIGMLCPNKTRFANSS